MASICYQDGMAVNRVVGHTYLCRRASSVLAAYQNIQIESPQGNLRSLLL